MTTSYFEEFPDVWDGLTRKERVILYCLNQLQKERGGRNVPSIMLYGRVIEYIDMSEGEFITLTGRRLHQGPGEQES